MVRRLEDGALLLRSHAPEANFTRPPSPDHPLVQAARVSSAGVLRYAADLDARPVIAAWRVPPGLPFSVAAAFDEDVELAGFYHHRRVVRLGAGILTVVLLALAVALAAWMRSQQARAILAEQAARQREGISWPTSRMRYARR